MHTHQISEYIDNLSLQKSFCNGYRPDEVYEVICTISSMYNQILSEAYEENEELRQRIKCMEEGGLNGQYIGQESGTGQNTSDRNVLMSDDLFPAEMDFEEKALQDTDEIQGKEESISGLEGTQKGISIDRELQKLKRSELLEIMLDQSRENKALKMQLEDKLQKIDELNHQLKERKIAVKEAGNIADASLKLNGVFDAAQKAAQQYLDNLKDLYEQEAAIFSQKEKEAESLCATLVKKAKEQCDSMRETVENECRKREQKAEERCKVLDAKAKEDVDKRWKELEKRLETFYISRENPKDNTDFI